jgi:hypothetical protein
VIILGVADTGGRDVVVLPRDAVEVDPTELPRDGSREDAETDAGRGAVALDRDVEAATRMGFSFLGGTSAGSSGESEIGSVRLSLRNSCMHAGHGACLPGTRSGRSILVPSSSFACRVIPEYAVVLEEAHTCESSHRPQCLTCPACRCGTGKSIRSRTAEVRTRGTHHR